MATNVYIGQVTLDVNLYREAKQASALSDREKQIQYANVKAQHVRDVQACQSYFQLSEFVFDTSSSLSSIAVAGKWLPTCVSAAKLNFQKLLLQLQVEASEVATLNVVSLNNIGPLKSMVMQKLQQQLPHFDGVTLVFLPVVPRKAFSRTLDTVEDVHEEGADAELDGHEEFGNETGDESSDVDGEAAEAAAVGAGASQDSLP